MVVVLADPSPDHMKITDAGSRVIQGILTGIGFLGAGVIVHAQNHFWVHGLTSAACTWFAACVGIACGVGQWRGVSVRPWGGLPRFDLCRHCWGRVPPTAPCGPAPGRK